MIELPAEIKQLEEKGISKEFLLERFDEQLKRDFEMCGALGFLKHYYKEDLNSIQESLAEAFEQMDTRSSQSLQQLMYRIDVPEKDFSAALQEQDRYSKLAELCIRRLLQKVILKLIYSK